MCLVWMIMTSAILYASGILFLKFVFVDGQELGNFSTWTPVFAGFSTSLPFIGLFVLAIRKTRYKEAAALNYEQLLRQLLSDKALDETELQKLNELRVAQGISHKVLNEIHRSAYLDALWDTSENLQLDSKELERLQQLSDQLGLGDSLNAYSSEFVTKVNRINSIMNGTVEGIEPPIGFILRKGEACYFYEDCALYENVTSSAFVGTSFRLGHMFPTLNPRLYVGKRVSYDPMKPIDKGMLAITNAKIVFLGNVHNREFAFEDVLGIDVAYDGIQIRRAGKSRLEVFRMNALQKELAVLLISYLTRAKG